MQTPRSVAGDAHVIVQASPSTARSKGTTASDEDVAFANLSNAVLQTFDRSFDSVKLKPVERDAVSEQIRSRAEEVVETLKIHVKDELDSIRKTELGVLKAREQNLMADIAAEKQKVESLQNQLRAMKEALDAVNKKHADDLQQQQHTLRAKHEAESETLKLRYSAENRSLQESLQKFASAAAGRNGDEVDKLQKHYVQIEAFHASHVSRLQSEIDAHSVTGNTKDVEARTDALKYHTAELQKIRAMIKLTREKSSMLEEAVKALKAQFEAEMDESKRTYAEKVLGEKAAMEKEYASEIEKLRAALAASQGELADKNTRQDIANRGAEELEAIKAEHSAALAKLKEQHREDIYLLQAKQAKLQKELSLRLDPLSLHSQDSGTFSTTKRRMGSTMGQTTMRRTHGSGTPKKVDFKASEDESMASAPVEAAAASPAAQVAVAASAVPVPERNAAWWAAQAQLMSQLDDLDDHYEEMHAKRGRLEDYDG